MVLRYLLLLLLSLVCTASIAFAEDVAPIPTNADTKKASPLSNNFPVVQLFQEAMSGNVISYLESEAKSEMNSEAVGVSKSFLQKYFPTVEIQLDMFDFHKTTSGVLVVIPLSDPNDVKHTFFMQDSVYHSDGNRTTLNLGVGYRQLEFDNKLILGANGFYDYEFPYGNRRTSIGLEARTTVAEVNFNQYFGASGWINGANSLQERSLGGTDLEVGLALPFMNWAKVYAKDFIWYGVDGAGNIRGNDISLRAAVPLIPGLTIEGGHRTYVNANSVLATASGLASNENFLQISYNLMDLNKPRSSEPLFSNDAYSFRSMEDHRYDKVRRENLIVKQTRGKNSKSKILIGGF